MQLISVAQNGIGYLNACLHIYQEGTAFLLLYALCIIVLIIRGSDKEKEIFLPSALVMLITVYNPIVPLVLDKIFDVNSEYYRLFWLSPIVVLVPYIAVKIIIECKSRSTKLTTGLLIIVILILSGNFVYKDGFDAAENIYKIPDELIEISRIIHDDSDSEYTKAFFEYEYNMEIRQYDPKMLLTIDREDYIYAVNYAYRPEEFEEDDYPQKKLLGAFVRNQNVSTEAICQALEQTQTEYIVLSSGQAKIDELINTDKISKVAQTTNHIILKYAPDEPAEYGLIDYTGVEHRFSYRMLK